MLYLVMHNVLIFVLVNPPRSACERRSCCSRLSDWLHTGSIQFDKSGRKRQWRRYAIGTTLEQNATISTNKNPPRVNKFSRKRMLGLLLRTYVHTHTQANIGETGASCYRGRLLQGRFLQNYHIDGEIADSSCIRIHQGNH